MNIEDIVCDIKYAKKLKELGVTQNSIFCYIEDTSNNNNISIGITPDIFDLLLNPYSAFTADELNKLLNVHIIIGKNFGDNTFGLYYQPEKGTDNSYTFSDEKLSNLLAKCLIAQIQEGEFK